jgi:type I restriction enzyme S subunit
MKLKIDKTNWTPVSLGDVVAERRKSTKDPVADGLQHIVGLEHIDAESIHLRRSEPISSDTTFSKTFKKGDVLFGRRRAYLKKAAQAPFAGICSGDITVMHAKDGLLPELLPFLVNNDKFFDYAVEHSAGGLSPRVKFRDLANYQFLLPPKTEQARLAELLWAGDEVLEGLERVKDQTIWQRECLNKRYFSGYRTSPLKIEKFNSKVGSGSTPRGGSKVYKTEGIRFLRSQNILERRIDLNEIAHVEESVHEKMKNSKVYNGDVLLNITGASIGRAAIYSDDQAANVNQHVCIIRTTTGLDNYFLMEFLNSGQGQRQISTFQAGGNREGLNFSAIRSLRLPNYDIDQQKNISLIYRQLGDSLLKAKESIRSSKSLQKSLINQIF